MSPEEQYEEFYSWLMDQDYWIEDKYWKQRLDEYPNLTTKEMIGITKRGTPEGDSETPRRDIRMHLTTMGDK